MISSLLASNRVGLQMTDTGSNNLQLCLPWDHEDFARREDALMETQAWAPEAHRGVYIQSRNWKASLRLWRRRTGYKHLNLGQRAFFFESIGNIYSIKSALFVTLLGGQKWASYVSS